MWLEITEWSLKVWIGVVVAIGGFLIAVLTYLKRSGGGTTKVTAKNGSIAAGGDIKADKIEINNSASKAEDDL